MTLLTMRSQSLLTEFMASVVVFLVALPLCMGVAIASGVPPALGLITGVVGGIIVGFFSGQPLQVSGPAAGLAVMVFQIIQSYGLKALGISVLVAGILQLVAGSFGLGRWFRAVAPAVIQGMLAGIGVLIFASQFHVMLDDKPQGSGILNLISIPLAIKNGFFPPDGKEIHQMAAIIGVLTIVSLVLWNRFKPQRLKMIAAPLVAVVVGTTTTFFLNFPIKRVDVPENLLKSINWVTVDSLTLLTNPAFWGTIVGLAIIASAETLLSAAAVDRMHDGARTNYNKELRAQGLGNILCGIFGALPMTGVIVRSSANVEAGAKTKWSTIFHGGWILISVVLFPFALKQIPTATLAAILVYTGWKLLGLDRLKEIAKKGRSELFIWGATVLSIVAINLLAGVIIGFGLAIGRLLITFTQLDVEIINHRQRYDVVLRGAATFVSIPKLAESLENIPNDSEVYFHLDDVAYIDHACIELIEDWHQRHPGHVFLETDRLQERNAKECVFNAPPKAKRYCRMDPPCEFAQMTRAKKEEQPSEVIESTH